MKYFFRRVIFLTALFLPAVIVLNYRRAGWTEIKTARTSSYVAESKNVANTTMDLSRSLKRFSSRRAQMEKICKSRPHSPLRLQWKVLLNALVDLPSRLLVCAVPKSGSSSWHFIIWALRRKRQGLDQDQTHYTANDTKRNQGIVSMVKTKEGNQLLHKAKGDDDFTKPPPANSSFRVILARHPFARFISGWNQKFRTTSNYWVSLFKTYRTILSFRKTPTEGHVMSFSDFATFLVTKYGDGKYFDSHFHPASTLCRPCEYDYTYVLKAESLEEDEPWFMQRLNLTGIGSIRSGIGPGRTTLDENVKETIKSHISLLKQDTVKRLYKLYEADFDFFGYTFNFTTLEAGGFD